MLNLASVLVIELRLNPTFPFFGRAEYRCLAEPVTDPDLGPSVCGIHMCFPTLAEAEGFAYRHAAEVHGDSSPFVCMADQL